MTIRILLIAASFSLWLSALTAHLVFPNDPVFGPLIGFIAGALLSYGAFGPVKCESTKHPGDTPLSQ